MPPYRAKNNPFTALTASQLRGYIYLINNDERRD